MRTHVVNTHHHPSRSCPHTWNCNAYRVQAEARALERMHQDLEARKKLAAAEDVDTADDMYDDTNADGSADDAFSQMLDDVDEEGEGDDEDEVDLDADDPTPNHVEL